jgi:hypothetical protein
MIRNASGVDRWYTLPITVKRLGWDDSSINIDGGRALTEDIGVTATYTLRHAPNVQKAIPDWSLLEYNLNYDAYFLEMEISMKPSI